MTFNTGNPIGSTDARDLSDNAENFDTALGTTAATWVDRFGVTRDSFEGRLTKGSFYRVGTFAAGYTLTNMRQTLEYSGHEYSWAGTFPKVVAAGATPATSGGIGAGAWVDRTDVTLRGELALNTGSNLIGFGESYISEYMESVRVPIEVFGAVGDYNPGTLTGTDCSPAFAAAKAAGVKIQLKKDAKYMITSGIEVYSGMDIYGDEAYTPEIYPNFSSPGVCMLYTNLSNPTIQENISLKGFTLVRIGNNAEHGGVIDNVDNLYVDIKIVSDGSALGGALGVSAFYPVNRPSTNCYCKVQGERGGNFMLQYGNVDNGTMQVFAKDSMREVIGVEPYALGKYDFSTGDVVSNTINITGHGLTTGYPLIYSMQGNPAITGFSRANYFFAIRIDDNNIKISNSKEEALDGVFIPIAAFTGTHRLYKCGIARNITVLPSTIDVGDVALAGSLTGLTIFTATSGGYHENINVSKISTFENNATSGNISLGIFGAQNITVNDYESIGAKLSGIEVTRGFLHSISDSTGDISPSMGLELKPRVIINNPTCRGFKTHGIHNDYGIAFINNPNVASKVTGAIGIEVSADASASGSRVRNATADVPNGTAYIIPIPGKNYDVNVSSLKDRLIKKVAVGAIYKTATSLPSAVCALAGVGGSTSVYAGQLYIIAKGYDTDVTETATYMINVIRAYSGASPVVAVINQAGLTNGGGRSFPSFTWSIDGSQNLIATAVGVTDPAKTWHFYIYSTGDVLAS